jgi:uncharacterized protein YggE
MKNLVRACALAALLSGSTALAAHAQNAAGQAERMFDATTLSLSAHGEMHVTPDKAALTLGVQTKAPTAAEAMRQNADQMTMVIAALRRAGVAEKDIRTSNINLAAQYDYQQNQTPRLTGYEAANDVSVTVDDLTRLGPAIDAVTAAGANQLYGISFGLKDPGAAEDAARRQAVQALRAKAALYAEATGYRVGRLISLSEGGGYRAPQVQGVPVMAMARAAAPTPVSAGELTVRIDIDGLYELAR